MRNPIFSENTVQRARTEWSAPDPSTRSTMLPPGGSTTFPGSYAPPSTTPIDARVDAPSATRSMTLQGTVTASATLLALLLVSAVFGWQATKVQESGFSLPPMAWGGVIVGLVAVVASSFRPHWAKVLAPVYALAEGFFVGAISRAYDFVSNGIVLQAIGATIAVFAVMLVLYRTNVIRVTDRFRKVVIGATIGLMLFYLVAVLIQWIGDVNVSFLHSSSWLGIGFSVLAAGLAAFNLALDFDLIERGVKERWPKGMEWFLALGLLVTLVWLYLELLRLLAKLQDRN